MICSKNNRNYYIYKLWNNHILFKHRSTEIDYQRIKSLCFLGAYQRQLPVNLNRMIENAYDWAHLPFIHPSSFTAIELHSEADWGWRARVTLPNGAKQNLELLIDREQHYWATTVLSGIGKGFEIHTKAQEVAKDVIDIDVGFYMPSYFQTVFNLLSILSVVLPFSIYRRIALTLGVAKVEKGKDPKLNVLEQLQAQYSVLYDEDQVLMSGRQEALNRRKDGYMPQTQQIHNIGDLTQLKQNLPHVFQIAKDRFCVNIWQGSWVIYSADCPHLLGPLEHSKISDDGKIECPWHGFQFNIRSGRNCSNDGRSLKKAPELFERNGELLCRFS